MTTAGRGVDGEAAAGIVEESIGDRAAGRVASPRRRCRRRSVRRALRHEVSVRRRIGVDAATAARRWSRDGERLVEDVAGRIGDADGHRPRRRASRSRASPATTRLAPSIAKQAAGIVDERVGEGIAGVGVDRGQSCRRRLPGAAPSAIGVAESRDRSAAGCVRRRSTAEEEIVGGQAGPGDVGERQACLPEPNAITRVCRRPGSAARERRQGRELVKLRVDRSCRGCQAPARSR